MKKAIGLHRYRNFTTVMGKPSTIIKKLSQKDNLEEFFRMTPAQLAALQPKVRLFKLHYPVEHSKTPIEYELVLPDYTSPETVEK